VTNARTSKSTREKAAELRAEALRKEARRRAITVGLAVFGVLVVLIGGVTLFRSLQNQQNAKNAAAAAPPAHLTDGGFLVGNAAAPVKIDLYEDFQCPICQNFEKEDGAMLQQYAARGKVKLIYRPVAILDQSSSTNYSTRALNAMATVIDTSPSSFVAFHKALFDNQPAENTAGLPDSTLIDLADNSGASQAAIQGPITNLKYQGWTANVTNNFTQTYTGTPTVLINGTQVKDLTPSVFKAAIDKAIAG